MAELNMKGEKKRALPEGWRKVRLSEAMHIIGGGTPKTTVSEYWGGEIYWLTPPDFVGSNRWVAKSKKTITEIGLHKSATKILRKGDLIFSARGTVGAVAQLKEPMAFSQTSYGLRAKSEIIVNDFLFYLIRYHKERIKKFSHGATFDTVTTKTFDAVIASLPQVSEQKAIASLLEKWDTAIEKTEALIAAKEKQFKWLLKRLISDQQDNPEWQKVKLGSIGNTFSGLSGKTKKDFGEGKPFITYLNVYENISINPSQIGLCVVAKGEKQNAIVKGDVLFTTSSETSDEVGVSSVLLKDIGECYLNSFCFGWRRNPKGKSTLSDDYLKYFLRSAIFRKKVRRLSQGATRYNLSKKELMKVDIYYPDIKEQKKIAYILDSLPQEIVLLKQLAEQYRTQKRGLMQKLLTGEWRIAPRGST